MEKKLFETINCNICGSNDFKIIYNNTYGQVKEQALIDKYRSSGDETLIDQLVECKKCKFIYINPRLKPQKILEGYSEGTDETFVSQAKGREITFDKSMKLIEKYSKKGKILDIGTAGGSFLSVAKKRGWDVYGVEPNKWLCKWGKKNYGIDIKPGTVYEQKYKTDSFDVVTLWDVLEHVPDPKKELKEVNRILKKDGILVVNYPDIKSWISRILGRRWPFLLSVHLFYFTPKTIKMMLVDTGFEVLKIKPHFQKLSLGYIVLRIKPYFGFVYSILNPIINFLRMDKIQIPYWLGQTLVIARKK